MSFANWWWRARYKSSPEFWFFLLFHTPECSKGSANHWSRCPCSPHQKGLSNSVLANKNSKLSCAEIMEPEAKRGKLSQDSSGARSMKDCHSWGCHATTCNYQYMFSNQRVFSGCWCCSIDLCFVYKIWTSNHERYLYLNCSSDFQAQYVQHAEASKNLYLKITWYRPIDEYSNYRLGFKI